MDKRQQLIDIIKKATLPQEIEKLILDEVSKQAEVSDDFILTVADTLERLGLYFKTAGEIQNEYLDAVLEEAKKVEGAVNVLDSLTKQLEEGENVESVVAPANTAGEQSAPQADASPVVNPQIPQ